jgi:hypothetical protein
VIKVGAALRARDFLTVAHKAWTLSAFNNFRVDEFQSIRHVRFRYSTLRSMNLCLRAQGILLHVDGKAQPRAASVRIRAIHKRETSTVRFGNLPAEHETDPRTAGLGCEKRHEKICRVGKAGAVVFNEHFD